MSEQLRPEATPHHDEEWDAGDLGCGDLVLALRQRLLAMPDRTLKLLARDPGAPADIPAYCRMTGHQLVHERPEAGCWWIRARKGPPAAAR